MFVVSLEFGASVVHGQSHQEQHQKHYHECQA
jgi:hypothetical protein